MKGDFTRWTFRPQEHYHGVLKQQGRVDLDADWNEQTAIMAHRVETETVDVIGPAGAPQANPGFVLKPTPDGKSLLIGKGRAYVDGLLCENETDVDITQQPDVPKLPLPSEQGVYLAVMRVWLRHITCLDDAEIREVALGGPDTCTRARVVWQAFLLPIFGSKGQVTCSSSLAEWDALVAPPTGTLAARAQPDPAATDPCTIPAMAGYRRLENQLYRVEVHRSGGAGHATFKWSRDNGSIVTSIASWPSGSDQITVSGASRDSVTGFAAGQWVEITDDYHDLALFPGTVVQLANVQGNTLTINKSTAVGPINPADFPQNPKVRRWDSNGNTPALQTITAGSWLDLESGVQVNFGNGTYNTGDYWMIPARTLTANVDWPVANGVPVAQPRKGVQLHYCKLAVVQLTASGWSVQSSCLPVFPPLTAIGTGTGTGVGASHALHVTAVNLVSAQGTVTPLVNDTVVPISNLEGASIQVVIDTPVNPLCAKIATCFVTVDVPRFAPNAIGIGGPTGSPGVGGFLPLILDNAVSANGNAIQCTFSEAGFALISEFQREQTPPLLAHLTLKGAKIWSRSDPRMYLDGDAFGVENQGNIGLTFPSGGGLRGSDFEMWFWIGPYVPPVLT